MEQSVIILGAGGHAKVLIDLVQQLPSFDIVGITDADQRKQSSCVLNESILGTDNIVEHYDASSIELVNGLGMLHPRDQRFNLYQYFKEKNYVFPTLKHPSAIVSIHANLAEGVQVMAGVIIQTASCIGENTIINTGASIDHDCIIGAHVHVAPGVTLSGGVQVREHTLIGTGAIILPGIHIGSNCTIAAGAVVTRDIASGDRVRGVPARRFEHA